MNPLCIYHANCLDGIAAAWAVWLALDGELDLYPAQYGEVPPDVTGRDVVIVDFSYKRDVLLQMHTQAKSILVLDHHKTAQTDLEGLDFCQFDMTRSGAQMAWDYFHPGERRPYLIDLVADRDLWQFKYPETKAVCAALFSYDLTVQMFDLLVERGEDEIESEGVAILRVHNKAVAEAAKHAIANELVVEDKAYRMAAVNAPANIISDLGNKLAETYDCALLWRVGVDNEGTAKIFCSLRSLGTNDVSELARMFGGGGHKNAAGFTLPIERLGTLGAGVLRV